MHHVRVAAILAASVVLASCQTIVEELPASAVMPSSAPVPIVVIQMPQVQPAPPPSVGGSGGGAPPPGGSQPAGQPTAAPSQPQPDNGCWRGNCNPVASIHAHVYYVQCNGEAVDGYRYATAGPWECDVVLDATPKDARGLATNSSGRIDWDISGGWTVVNGSSFTPKILGGKRGDVTFSARVDGVTSNVTTYTFR